MESDRVTLIDAKVLDARSRSGTSARAAETCADCGEEIPAERREAMEELGMACERCVSCQTRVETRANKGR
ncbi:MAG: TraR/DksA C4-type zinc finger protein [Desulfobacteraceae bacterium]|nr:TraR/DksA C4-type zinc finger protein [Desulfobacteraceae bacterium]